MRPLLASLALAIAVLAPGCWYHVEDYCPGCAVIDCRRPAVPPIPHGTHTVVVLVHGAFGFGDEWSDVVKAIAADAGFFRIAFSWPGPWPATRPPLPATALALARTVQVVLDAAPPSVTEVLVLAHSAGGMLANFAARQLRVPPGRHVTVALLDPALGPSIATRVYSSEPDTPFGEALSSTQAPYPPPPPRVAMTVYEALDPNSKRAAAKASAAPVAVDATDLPHVFVGAIGHNAMVARACLPLIAARRADAVSSTTVP